MVAMERVLVTWTGQTGLPGVSVFYGAPGSSVNTDVKAFFTSIRAEFGTALSWTVPGSGDTIDSATGALTGSWSNPTGGGIVQGLSNTAYAAGVGAYVNWGTGVIANGRRVRGRTFLTNINAGDYDVSGTILTGAITSFTSAASTLYGTAKLVIWHRPPRGGSTGQACVVTSATVPDQVTSLRTRRR